MFVFGIISLDTGLHINALCLTTLLQIVDKYGIFSDLRLVIF